MSDRITMTCVVENATQADIDRWLANHATGRHHTYIPSYDKNDKTVLVDLANEKDRIALKESFDVIKTQYRRSVMLDGA